MHVEIERRPGSRVALTVTVEPEVLKSQMARLFQKQASRVTVPGFRPGKAPRKMIEERIDHNRLMHLAIDAVVETTYKEALRENNLDPLEQGEIEELTPSEDMTLTYKVLVSVRPEINLPTYTGLEVHQHVTEVTDEMVATEIEHLRDRSADSMEITEGGIETGDYVTVDYTMRVDGEPYPEGDVTGYPLEVGTDTFFPELNEGLLGMALGETKTISHDYPEDYSDKALAGNTAEFDITVQQIRRRVKPDATDEWVKVISNGSMETLDELRTRIQQNLQAMAERSDHDQLRNELVRQVISAAEIDLPEVQVEEEYQHLIEELEQRLSHERMDLTTYAEMTDQKVSDIENERRILARDLVRRSLVLGEIARRENITVTTDDIDAALAVDLFSRNPSLSRQDLAQEITKLRKEYEKTGHIDNLEGRIRYQKVVTFLEEQATIIPDAHAAETPAPESLTDEHAE